MDAIQQVKWYRKAAEQGDAVAQYNLGIMYSDGRGVPQNYSEAYVWSSLAATSGDEDAVHNRDIYAKKLSSDALISAKQKAAKLYEKINANEFP